MILTGLDIVLRENFARFRGKRVGLVTHPAALDGDFSSAEAIFTDHTNLVTLFGPEHGFTGEAQDLIPVGDGQASPAGPRRISLYGDTFASLKPTPNNCMASTFWSLTCRTSAAGTTRSRRRCSTAWKPRPRSACPS